MPSDDTWSFTADPIDRRLLEVDVRGSIAHVAMLGETGVIDRDDASRLLEGLDQILETASRDEFEFEPGDEDVHTAVERRLGELIGPVAGKLHTGRSRNDQIALDMRLYLEAAGRSRQSDLASFIEVVTRVAEHHAATVVPSYTHLQQAQVNSLGNHLLAYAWMALRSLDRFDDVIRRLSRSPLGAGPSAGSSLALSRSEVAATLGMSGVVENTLDAVGTRDIVAEYVFICAQAMTDLSRLAEEVVLWVSTEFGWARLAEDATTGSSALPQKRNPDVAELVRGRAASVAGDLTAIISLQKGMALTYSRDFQEDKRLVFHADDVLSASLRALAGLLESLEFDPPEPGANITALDFAELLVARGVPFREAHQVVAALVRNLGEQGRDLSSVTDEDLKRADSRYTDGDSGARDPSTSIASRAAVAGAEAVIRQIDLIRADLDRRSLA